MYRWVSVWACAVCGWASMESRKDVRIRQSPWTTWFGTENSKHSHLLRQLLSSTALVWFLAPQYTFSSLSLLTYFKVNFLLKIVVGSYFDTTWHCLPFNRNLYTIPICNYWYNWASLPLHLSSLVLILYCPFVLLIQYFYLLCVISLLSLSLSLSLCMCMCPFLSFFVSLL